MAIQISDPKPFKAGFSTIIKFIIFLGIGILIIWISLKDLTPLERQEIMHSFQTANYNWVILSVFLGIASHLMRSLRWMLFFEPMGYRPSLKNTFYAVMIGYFANTAFPRLGEVTRCGILARYEKIPFNKSFGTVITERVIDILIFICLFFLMIFTQIGTIDNYLDTNVYPRVYAKFQNPSQYYIYLYALIGLILVAIFSLFLFRKKLVHSSFFRKVKKISLGFWEGLKSLSLIRKPLLFIVYSLTIWVLYFLMLYVIFFCFPETSSLGVGACLSALVLGSVGIMITPGGIGLYPLIIQETLLLYGTSLTTGLALGWISWTAQTLMIILLGTLALIFLSFNKQKDGIT